MATDYAEGDRIYATELLAFGDAEDPDFAIERGEEGAVAELTGDDAHDLLIKWDAGFLGTVNSGSVAPIGEE
jgi:hypothetical protein